ncbi:MAG: hypothetical protein ACOX41_05590 [Anaerovoracaceae bacterium]|jgi:hypothetical protein
MELQELLEMLELDDPEDFEYYENFADLLESDEEIPEDTLFQLFSQVDRETTEEMLEGYFAEMQENVPDSETEFYMLLENIRLSLLGLIRAADDESLMERFAEELARFKNWYTFESGVTCIDRATEEQKLLPLRDALTLARMAKLDNEDYSFDFNDCLDYEMEDYIMDFGDLARLEDSGEEDDLFRRGYVYDDEMKRE